MAARVADMLCNFYSVKSHKIANNSATTEARAKISTDLEALELYKFFIGRLIEFKNNQNFLYKVATDLY